MKLGLLVIAAGMSLSISAPCAAQRVNVRWEATANDVVGRVLASRVRERLASSPLFTLVYGQDVSALVVHFVTIHPDGSGTQYSTGYALVINGKFRDENFERYLTTTAGVCGRDQIPNCADSIVAEIDTYADLIRNSASR